jgi:Flp pilus assembly protein TadD
MSSLAEIAVLVGFFSYSREDDEDSNGTLSALRERIQRELRGQLGRSTKSLRLWQDKEAIAPGTLWAKEIEAATAEAVFFIPIITPTSVRSPYCKVEFDSFLAREKELGRADLVFPIVYIRVPGLESSGQQDDPVLSLIAKRQYVDWRGLRQRDVHSMEVKEAVQQFCEFISEALRRPWQPPQHRPKMEEPGAQQRATPGAALASAQTAPAESIAVDDNPRATRSPPSNLDANNSRVLADFNKAIELNPRNASLLNERGSYYYNLKKDFDLAIADYTKAIEIDPKNVTYHSNRGAAYYSKGDYDRAIADYSRAIELNTKSAEAFRWRGKAHHSRGDYDRAIADIDRALELDPKNAVGYCNRADAYARKGEHDRAAADYAEAIQLGPKDADVFNLRGNYYYNLKKDFDLAIADYTKAIEIDPKNVTYHSNRGAAYYSKGDYDRAIAEYSRAIELDPKEADAYRWRGKALASRDEGR